MPEFPHDILPLIASIIAVAALVFALFNCVTAMTLEEIDYKIRMRLFWMMIACVTWLGGLQGLIYRGTKENITVSSIWLFLSTVAFIWLAVSVNKLRKERQYTSINTPTV
jgi:Ca2+/Na+ antiporter